MKGDWSWAAADPEPEQPDGTREGWRGEASVECPQCPGGCRPVGEGPVFSKWHSWTRLKSAHSPAHFWLCPPQHWSTVGGVESIALPVRVPKEKEPPRRSPHAYPESGPGGMFTLSLILLFIPVTSPYQSLTLMKSSYCVWRSHGPGSVVGSLPGYFI